MSQGKVLRMSRAVYNLGFQIAQSLYSYFASLKDDDREKTFGDLKTMLAGIRGLTPDQEAQFARKVIAAYAEVTGGKIKLPEVDSDRLALFSDSSQAGAGGYREDRVARTIRQLLSDKGKSFVDLAAALGIPANFLKECISETDPAPFAREQLVKVAAFFEVELDSISFKDVEARPKPKHVPPPRQAPPVKSAEGDKLGKK